MLAIQVEYSLVARDVEAEHLPAARDTGMGVMPWSPLAGGFLTGKYNRAGMAGSGRLTGPNPFGDSKFSDRNWAVLDVVRTVAGELGCKPARVALAWVMSRRGVASTIIAASRTAQLDGIIAACSVRLDDDQLRRLV